MRRSRPAQWPSGLCLLVCLLIILPSLPATPATYAQSADCAPEAEPNNVEAEAEAREGEFCVSGQLVESADQDLIVWTITEDDAKFIWNVRVDGVAQTATAAKIFAIQSEPGITPIIAGSQLLDIGTNPAGESLAEARFLVSPGAYLIGISRSETADFSVPADTGYQVSFSRSERLPKRLDDEPNDDRGTASQIAGEVSFAGDLIESADFYNWTVSDADAGSGWTISVMAALGTGPDLTITAGDGTRILYAYPDQRYTVSLFDLVFAPGTYGLDIRPNSPVSTPYLVTIAKAPLPVGDVEPNDEPAFAAVLDPDNPVVKGRLASTNDADLYRLTVDDQLAGSLLDLKVLTRSQVTRRVCLLSVETGQDLKCAEGPGGGAITNLLLPRGDYIVRISGETDPGDQYILRFDLTSAPAADFETEPNDDLAFSTTLEAGVAIRGTFDPNDYDTFRITVDGEPQLWDIQATGIGIVGLDYIRRDGTQLATGEILDSGASAAITDLYLTPGDHWLRIRGDAGDYSISMTPMGPPPVDGEHETNDTALTAEPMQVGERKTGRIRTINDTDVFRFSLAAREHVRIDLDVPDSGSYRVFMEWGQDRVVDAQGSSVGEDLVFDLTLEAGDYLIYLQPETVSEARYALDITRMDPFAVSDDQEPNDTVATAQLIVPGQTVVGELTAGDSYDVYGIPAGDDRDLTFAFTGDGIYLLLTDEVGVGYNLALNADGTAYEIDQRMSDDVPLYLQVSGTGPYEITYGPPIEEDDDSGGGLNLPDFLGGDDDDDIESAIPLEIAVALDATEVAAYWVESQSVPGVLRLTNNGPDPVTATILAATSHFHFTIDVPAGPVEIPAGQTSEVPFSVEIAADAWAGIPVQISFAADTGSGRVPVSTVITPTASASPMNPDQYWPVPEEMLGGLNLASPYLGAVPAGTINIDGEAQLYDGVAPIGTGLSVGGPVLPLTIDVDLAGDQAAPVAGILINNQGRDGIPQYQVRQFELHLSTDGVTFELVHTGELGSIVREQAFALPEPVKATHARLVILSAYSSEPVAPNYIQIGEWSVIAEPGFVPETIDEINVADWAAGGFVSRSLPQFSSPDMGIEILNADEERRQFSATEGTTFSWDVGFSDNRAAQVTRIEWVDPPEPDPNYVVTELQISISMGTPSGPWEPVGTWDLDRDGGAVDPFEFDEPIWARYIRFEGVFGETYRTVELPAQLRVIEATTSDSYHSVIGAWGSTNPNGPYELANPPASLAVADDNDAPDSRDDARPIELGETISGRAQIGADIDWYRVTADGGDNQLEFTLTGVPTVDVIVRVYTIDGDEVAVEREVLGSAATVVYRAPAEAGEEYLVSVEQPPHSIVFTFDTSGSMGAYAPLVQQSLRSFANGIEPGQEFVQVMAFDEDPLLETFTDDSYAVYSAINGYYDLSLSSSGETGILDSTELLAAQEGSTAILIITDAETGSYGESAKMWAAMDVVQPRVFAVHVGGSGTPVLNEHLMQNWSSLGGYYQYTTNQSEMDRAFDRAATWLRRPAGYTLTTTSALVEVATPTPEATATPAPPASLAVISGEADDGEEPAAQVSDAVTIEIILDTSGSMLAGMPDGQRRIDVARNVLTDLVTEQLPPGVPVTLRVFGNTPDSCDTSLLVPVGPLDPAAMAATIQAIEPVNLVRTPLGASLEQVANDLAGVSGPKIVVLVTDGEETCDGDPAAAIQSLVDQGIDVQVNIVGFALDDDALRDQFSDWAEIGNGSYFDATSSEELDDAIAKAVQAPYRVLDENGEQVAAGTVDGNPIELPPGTYTVVVLTDPEITFEAVVVESGETVSLELGLP